MDIKRIRNITLVIYAIITLILFIALVVKNFILALLLLGSLFFLSIFLIYIFVEIIQSKNQNLEKTKTFIPTIHDEESDDLFDDDLDDDIKELFDESEKTSEYDE